MLLNQSAKQVMEKKINYPLGSVVQEADDINAINEVSIFDAGV